MRAALSNVSKWEVVQAPRSSVAFVGGSIAAAALELCRDFGFGGPVRAVHPTRELVGGQRPVRSVGDLPEPPDAAFVAAPAEATIAIVEELAAIGAGGAICYAAGFAEAGRPELEQALRDAAGDRLALLGPNCYGLVDLVDGVSLWPAPFPHSRPQRGVALVLQSGNLGINLTMQQRGLDIGWVVTVGNQAGLDIAAHFYNANIKNHGGKLEAVLNSKGLRPEHRGTMVLDIERGRADLILGDPWQTDTCIGDWHYRRSTFEQHKYKSARTVIQMLVDIVSKNGNLLLNIPVRGDGTIDEDEQKILADLATEPH